MIYESLCFTIVVMLLSLWGNQCTQCDFFKNITLRLTPKSRYPYAKHHLVSEFSGCITESAFDEIPTALVIFNQNVTVIGDHAVEDLPELKEIAFIGCKVTSIANLAFRKLPKLQVLFIRGGELKQIETGVFHDIDSLEIISLDENNISQISIHAFGFIPSLKQVIVSNNKLKHFFSFWFTNSSNIELIDFSSNKIENIYSDAFVHIHNLKDIFLDFNEIKYIEAGTFKNLTSITYLGLSHNSLLELDPDIFPNKFYVESLTINANYLNFLSSKLLTKLVVKEIVIEGNPWKCPCLDRIQKWMFQSNTSIRTTNFCIGSHIPKCVYAEGSNFCTESINEELTQTYIKVLSRLRPPIHAFCAKLNKTISEH